MKSYHVEKPITLRGGRYLLSENQFANRKYVVRVLDAATRLVEPLREISFKAGEVVCTDVEIPKGLNSAVSEITAAQSKSAPESAVVSRAEPPTRSRRNRGARGGD